MTRLICALALLSWAGRVRADVAMLVPGFTVKELPVRISNVNNLRFTPDGRLTALGYDGRVHLLTDSDGDGLEDRDVLFWEKRTLTVPVGMAWSKDGLYVSSHGKVSLLRDLDGDGRADTEEIVASGWPPTDVASGGVDAAALTLDGVGNLYFGLLTADYSNPYRVKDGVSHYDLGSPRGTIQKWSPSTRRLETVATGIRVPYTLAFNRHGDLFLTDQEGETWCPGGNPLDELNHIVTGRNYGFPPRHEKHLPVLISEPPVVAFGPQHQSTCGLVFNEAADGRKPFGPPEWENDAFVTGESRGKLWRVRLVKTPDGYVGEETLIARLDMLATDVAISPDGALYVSCHSGKPDWGTGPNGEGKIFKITHQNPKAPQPTAIWASGPMEVSVAFDKPIDPSINRQVAGTKIEFGEYVSAADRLEVLKPPYKVVQQQEAAPRGRLRVVAGRLSDDRRTLTLTTDPHPQSVRYALTLPGVKADGGDVATSTVDLAYELNGVEAEWSTGSGGASTWNGWLPHLDWQVNSAFTVRSAGHGRLSEFLRRDGHLRLRTQLTLPPRTTLRIEASSLFTMQVDGKPVAVRPSNGGRHTGEVMLASAEAPQQLMIEFKDGHLDPLTLRAVCFTESDPTPRTLPFHTLLLPWAPPRPTPQLHADEKSDLTGGDFEEGRALFVGDRLKCATCHRMRGDGATVGPDLSNLAHRDAASVLQDIREPGARIHPDYVAYLIRRRNGGDLTGFVRAQDEASLRVLGADGREELVPRNEVDEMRPSAVSLMPTGLLDGLKESQVRSLMTFLLNEPPARSTAEVEAVQARPGSLVKPLKIVLVAGKQDHGPGQHDYPSWQKQWAAWLGEIPGVTVSEAWEWPSSEQWRQAGVIVLYFWNHDWSAERYRQLDEFQNRGGGLAVFHSATIADREPEKLAERLGLAAQPGPTKYLHTPLTLEFVPAPDHPITHGFKTLGLLDEPYWPMLGDTNRVEVLATAPIEGQSRPLIWTSRRGKGRVFASVPGHYTWTLDDPLFRILALRGIVWAAGEPAQP
jgi:putative heme-binding domain-containing protein